MKEFFKEDGHLTDFAFDSIINDNIEELNRLEIAEHTSFCDECLLKYMDLLDNSVLICPPEIMEQNIMLKIAKNTRRLHLNQYFSMAIAACFAMIFWVTGVFELPNQANNKLLNMTSSLTQTAVEFTDNISSISNNINIILNSIQSKGVIENEKK